MTLLPGSTLGPFRIAQLLGAGGMGEVYCARDTRLDRTVAIKVLPSGFATSADARARFEREARALSAQTHPHICTLYDVGQQDAVDYLVMEYVVGESLAERLTRGPVPSGEALRIGAEIAAALAAAHRAGIVHRDLKPGNVMLTKSGVKVLDFGLAKLRPAGDAGVPGASTRFDGAITGEGVLVGTLPYMAPEQLEGKEADSRTDVWALGTVLYEMATGCRPFDAASQARLIGAILKDRPQPVSVLQPLAPRALDHVVGGCLEKDPDDRWQSAQDVERELRWIAEGATAPSSGGRPRRRTSIVAAGAAGLLLTGAFLGWIARRSTDPADRETSSAPIRASIMLPQHAALAPASATPFNYLRESVAVSPDESRIVYVGLNADRRTQLYSRPTAAYEPSAIPGTEGGFDPFFSPDGEWIGFFTFDSLLKVSLKGGAPLVLASVVNPVGGTWCDDGNIYFAGDEGDELWQLAAGGAAGQTARRIGISNMESSYPHCLPGSKGLLVTMAGEGTDGAPVDTAPSRPRLGPQITMSGDYGAVGLLTLPAKDSEPKVLVRRGYAAQYAPSGHIVFARGGNLMAAPFDLGGLRVTGPEATVLTDVRMNSVSVKAAQFTVTRGGSLLYARGDDQSRTRLVWVDRHGKVEPTAVSGSLFGTLQVSPNGKQVVTEVAGIQDDIYVYDLDDGRRVRVTNDGLPGQRPIWHPDGHQVVFRSKADGQTLVKSVDSDAGPQRFAIADHGVSSWSPRGLVAGMYQDRIWIGALERPTMITSQGRGRAWGAVISPDGALVAYTSSRTGTFQVFVQPYPATGQEWQVSSDFGEEPVWSRTSPELFFRRHNQWWSVAFTKGTPGSPKLLFEGPFFNAFGPSYDVAPDGRFLMALPPAAGEPTRELLWVNRWTQELGSALTNQR